MIVRLIGAATLADAAWQIADRKGWVQFWGKSLYKLRKPTTGAMALAAGELLLGAWLVLRGGGQSRVGGDVAKFRTSSGHHPITAS
jgi:hypothetical protein